MVDRNDHSTSFKRRKYLKAAGAAGIVGLAGCSSNGSGGNAAKSSSKSSQHSSTGGSNSSSSNSAGPDYSKYEGMTIDFALATYKTEWEAIAKKFEKETGIKVNLTAMAHSSMLGKLRSQLRAHQATYDAWISDVIWTGSLMSPGWVEPLHKYMQNPDLAMPNYDWNDFLPDFQNNYGLWKGTIYGLPWFGDIMKLVVRKDLLKKYESEYKKKHNEPILPPWPKGYKDYAHFDRVAKFMHSKGWPMGLGGKKGWNIVYWYPNRFASATGKRNMIDRSNNTPRLNMNGAKQALQVMVNEAQNYAYKPLETGYTQSRNQFLDGKTWSVEQWGTATHKFIKKYGWEDKIRVVLTPGGYPNLGGWGIMINSFADKKKKEAAFLLAQWATSKKMDKWTYKKFGVTPTRKSSFTKPILKNHPQARYQDPKKNPGIKTPSLRPRQPNYKELANSMASQFNAAMAGNTSVDSAISSVQKSWKQVLSQ